MQPDSHTEFTQHRFTQLLFPAVQQPSSPGTRVSWSSEALCDGSALDPSTGCGQGLSTPYVPGVLCVGYWATGMKEADASLLWVTLQRLFPYLKNEDTLLCSNAVGNK